MEAELFFLALRDAESDPTSILENNVLWSYILLGEAE